jgi:Sec-independent protein translocase protein TatA
MISMMGFLLFLGLIVFGPKKTIEIAREVARSLAHIKHAAGQFQRSVMNPEGISETRVIPGEASFATPDKEHLQAKT